MARGPLDYLWWEAADSSRTCSTRYPNWWRKNIHPDDRPYIEEVIREVNRTKCVFELEHRVRQADGPWGWTHSCAVPMLDPDGHGRIVEWFGAASNITRRKRAEEALQASLEEKDILLRELSHRTKNNMQVIAGLLSLQAAGVSDGKLAEAFADAQDRIRAMALVHEKLYRSGGVSSPNIKEYAYDLATSFLKAHQGAAGPVKAVLELEEVLVSLDTALPCGLIINELFSNSLKHAFPEQKAGNIFLWLRRLGEKLELRYRDDGPGLPGGLDLSKVTSLGLKLVSNLAVRPLRGTMELANDPGTEFVFRFPLPAQPKEGKLASKPAPAHGVPEPVETT